MPCCDQASSTAQRKYQTARTFTLLIPLWLICGRTVGRSLASGLDRRGITGWRYKVSELKYLSDGRKVCVVGKINNTETIVQEVFVTAGGDEVPSGEKFVTKSLHDQPVISYAAKEKKRQEESLERIKKEIERATNDYKIASNKLKAIRDIVKSSSKVAESIDTPALDTLMHFLSGSIEYVVVDGWQIAPPQPFIDAVSSINNKYERLRYDGLKLLSVLGCSDGNLEYCLHNYSDSSGGSSRIYPFLSWDDAVNHIKSVAEGKIDNGSLLVKEFHVCTELGISFSAERVTLFVSKHMEDIKKQKAQRAEQYEKDIDAIGEIEILVRKIKGTQL
jgi:hypothetical protein